MKLPHANASYPIFVHYGVYVSRRLLAAKLPDLSAEIKRANDEVKAAGRARDDVFELIQDATASRDAAIAALDAEVAAARATLGGRAAKATREAPYIHIFPNGIGEYTAAPLPERVRSYRLLLSRAEASLPDNDPVGASLSTHIPTLLHDFSAAVDTLDAARARRDLLDTDLNTAQTQWRALMERTYGALIARFGKGRLVEGFFPKP